MPRIPGRSSGKPECRGFVAQRALFVLASLWFTGLAYAQEGDAHLSDPSESVSEYTTEIEAALEEYQRGHFEEARGLFQHAHQLAPSARTLRGLGMVEFELRHYVRASELLASSLLDERKPLTAEQRADVDKLLRRTRTFVARYTIELEPASAEATLELDGASVELDAQRCLTASIGEHVLTVRAPGYVVGERRLDATGGEVATLRFVLVALAHADASTGHPDGPPRVTRPHRTLGAVLTTVGGLALVGGAAVGVVALLRAGDAPTQDGSEGEQARRLALVSDSMVAVGAASALTGLVLLLWRKNERAHPSGGVVVDSLAPQLRVRF